MNNQIRQSAQLTILSTSPSGIKEFIIRRSAPEKFGRTCLCLDNGKQDSDAKNDVLHLLGEVLNEEML